MAHDTEHFKVSEFTCKCGCGKNNIDQRVINMAETIRKALGVPVHINSGCRCDKHNKAVGGAKSSKHLKGLPLTFLAQKARALCSRLPRGSKLTANFLTSITAFLQMGNTHRLRRQAKITVGGSRMTDDMLGYSVHFLFGGIVSLMSWFFGGRDGFLMVLLTFMVIDQFSGLAAGWAEHKISSEAGFKGILKKCLILAFVGMAHLMDEYLFAHTVFGEHETARNVIALFYIGNEGISIIENADRLGIPIPGFIRDRFLNMKKLNKKKVSP